MKEYLDQLVNAVATRHSHRDFKFESLLPDHENRIREFLKSINVPFSHTVEIQIHRTPPGNSVVYYKEPPLFAAFLSDDSIRDQATVGFIGELFILFCESIGVMTCWMGHYNKKSTHRIVFACDEKNALKSMFCITPLGYIPDKTGFMDRTSQKRFWKKDKPLEKFLHPNSVTPLPSDIEFALKLASQAPSAMNTQNWYYLVEKTEGGYRIELSKPAGWQHFKWRHYDIDVGTAAVHIWLGLLSKGYRPRIELTDQTGDAIWEFYI